MLSKRSRSSPVWPLQHCLENGATTSGVTATMGETAKKQIPASDNAMRDDSQAHLSEVGEELTDRLQCTAHRREEHR